MKKKSIINEANSIYPIFVEFLRLFDAECIFFFLLYPCFWTLLIIILIINPYFLSFHSWIINDSKDKYAMNWMHTEDTLCDNVTKSVFQFFFSLISIWVVLIFVNDYVRRRWNVSSQIRSFLCLATKEQQQYMDIFIWLLNCCLTDKSRKS